MGALESKVALARKRLYEIGMSADTAEGSASELCSATSSAATMLREMGRPSNPKKIKMSDDEIIRMTGEEFDKISYYSLHGYYEVEYKDRKIKANFDNGILLKAKIISKDERWCKSGFITSFVYNSSMRVYKEMTFKQPPSCKFIYVYDNDRLMCMVDYHQRKIVKGKLRGGIIPFNVKKLGYSSNKEPLIIDGTIQRYDREDGSFYSCTVIKDGESNGKSVGYFSDTLYINHRSNGMLHGNQKSYRITKQYLDPKFTQSFLSFTDEVKLIESGIIPDTYDILHPEPYIDHDKWVSENYYINGVQHGVSYNRGPLNHTITSYHFNGERYDSCNSFYGSHSNFVTGPVIYDKHGIDTFKLLFIGEITIIKNEVNRVFRSVKPANITKIILEYLIPGQREIYDMFAEYL
ncbi:MAG: hypothetical protein Solumvirus5_3 [Solumvirus sp.]|uniref:Uncharacterized protein n=1 Tax=Solumvirus sp. TaxID=2487773 RepID=A0A3G5AGI4_9VIRU|nr:MAG: hypothetical protein Solumvirus5_3 [Solumvirus sp.]